MARFSDIVREEFQFLVAVIFLCVLFHIAERFSPAERGQSYRSMLFTNGKIVLA